MDLSMGTLSAPTFTVPPKDIVAVEHPMVVKHLDNGLKTFGGLPMRKMLMSEDQEGSIPLYLRTADPTAAPILSHNTPTNNVLLKVTVPKRTGRKRKRGSNDPYIQDLDESLEKSLPATDMPVNLRSHSRIDNSEDLLRRLKDNVDNYQIEAVGQVEQTHRFRGLSDFHYSTTHGTFMTKVRDTILTGNLDRIKEFTLDPKRGVNPVEELIPPPKLTDHMLPFNWAYHQNSAVKIITNEQTGQKVTANQTTYNKVHTAYIAHDMTPVPSEGPPLPPEGSILGNIVEQAKKALETRPIWTRRALMNYIGPIASVSQTKLAIQYVGYQFRGGPWRDAVIKFGLDPRTDPKYRKYQTLFFKIHDDGNRETGEPWQDKRSEYLRNQNAEDITRESHIFDGKTISLDGKVWQICDLTDPVLQSIASTQTLRDICDIESDGWFCNGTMAKLKTVTRVKIDAILAGHEIPASEFAKALAVPDHLDKAHPIIPVPDWRPPGHRDASKSGHEAKSTSTPETKLRRIRIRKFVDRDKSAQGESTDATPKRRRGRKPKNFHDSNTESGSLDGLDSRVGSVGQSGIGDTAADGIIKRKRGRPRKTPLPMLSPTLSSIGRLDGTNDIVRSIEPNETTEEDVDEDDLYPAE